MSQPSMTWLAADEDQASINDAMLLVDVGGADRFLDLPSRAHGFGYGIGFNDGHAEIYKFTDAASKNWDVNGSYPKGGAQRLDEVYECHYSSAALGKVYRAPDIATEDGAVEDAGQGKNVR